MLAKKIIIFDLWQTLADTASRPSALFDKISKSKNSIKIDAFLPALFSSDVFLKNVPPEDSFGSFLSNLKINDQVLLQKVLFLWKEISEKSFLIEEAEELIVKLKSKGYILCLLTNIDKYGYEHFPYQEIFDSFDFKFLSYTRGIGKPNKLCWEIIRKHFNVEYSDMVMIGDNLWEDIFPAKELGLETLWINSESGIRLSNILDSLDNM